MIESLLTDEAEQIIINLTNKAVKSADVITMGVMTKKCMVDCADGTKYIVRFYPDVRSYLVDSEPDVIKKCEIVGAKVPRIIGDSRTSPHKNFRYLAYEMLDGVPLSEVYPSLSENERELLVRQIGNNLRKIQKVSFECYGTITGLTALYTRWSEFLREVIIMGIQDLRDSLILSPQSCDLIELFMLTTTEKIVEPKRNLVWSDFSMDNIIVQGPHLCGFIDFEGIFSGDPILALGYLFSREGQSDFYTRITEVYCKEKVPNNMIWFYCILRILRIIKYYKGPLPAGGQRMPIEIIFPGFNLALKELQRQ